MRKATFIVLLVAGMACRADAAETPADRWNLADLYPSVDAWNADAAKVDVQMKRFGSCKGHLGESAARLAACLELQSDMTRRYFRLAIYSSQRHDEDTGEGAALALDQQRKVLGSKLREATAFVDPELLEVGRAKIDRFVASDKALRVYRYPLDDVLRLAPHTLDAEGEGILAAFALTADNASAPFEILTNADIPWPTIKLADGKDAKLDESGYTLYRATGNRDDRKRVMDAYFGTLKTYEGTLGATYYGQLKHDSVIAKLRKYPDSLTLALDGDPIPRKVYDTLIEQTNANLGTLHRYFKLRAKMLGVSDMRYYDIYPPLVSGGPKFSLSQAKQDVLAAVAPLGKDYVAQMERGFANRWMDAYPRPRKLAGAHMAGFAYDVHPYVLMNYNEDYDSVTTIAHEWGHAMHTVLANSAQPFPTAEYKIFIGEIASTLNEALLLDYMLRQARSDDERLLYLGEALEGLRGTFFRQAMFAEFEQETHARVDRGEPMTGEALTKLYGDILRRYHGEAAGVMKIDDIDCVEWTYIPHFYSAFYVYQYATSIAASSLFAQRIQEGQPGVLERYLGMLKAGASDDAYKLVKNAGVDLATPAPYQALVERMNTIMDQIEEILAKR